MCDDFASRRPLESRLDGSVAAFHQWGRRESAVAADVVDDAAMAAHGKADDERCIEDEVRLSLGLLGSRFHVASFVVNTICRMFFVPLPSLRELFFQPRYIGMPHGFYAGLNTERTRPMMQHCSVYAFTVYRTTFTSVPVAVAEAMLALLCLQSSFPIFVVSKPLASRYSRNLRSSS